MWQESVFVNNLHVRGYKEEGTTSTPFDLVVLNYLDRFRLVQDVIERLLERALPTSGRQFTRS